MSERPVRRHRRSAALILAAALLTTACSTGSISASGSSVASPGSSNPPATAAALTPSPSPATPPRGRLAYGVFSSSGLSLYTTDIDGTNTRLLVSKDAEQPRWSPDGRRLSVVVETNPVGNALVDPDGSHFVGFKHPDKTLSLGCTGWSPDGARLACGGWDDSNPARNGIYTARASDGGDLIQVTSAGASFDGPGDYSPDGRQILFLRAKHLDDELGTLMVVNVDGSDAHALTAQQAGQTNRWSPDGRAILIELGGSLGLVPIDGGPISTIKIDATLPVTASRASWSPDGGWIVFTGIRSTSTEEDLYIMRKDGTDLRQITNTQKGDEEFGAWGISTP